MKRKTYERPAMKTVELQHRTMLLSGSGEGPDSVSPKASINNWEDGDETDEDIYM